MKQATLAKTLG